MNSLVNEMRLYQILLGFVVSEKSTFVSEKANHVVFRVLTDANKIEVKNAVELLFKVQVESVQISNIKPKATRFAQMMGVRKGWKKAYVALKQGQKIDLQGAY